MTHISIHTISIQSNCEITMLFRSHEICRITMKMTQAIYIFYISMWDTNIQFINIFNIYIYFTNWIFFDKEKMD